MRAANEKRWAVITQDGRHTWLGRATDPTEAELAAVACELSRYGTAGWLAVTEGIYYGKGVLKVMMVRPLYGAADWDLALAAFHERRLESAGLSP